MSFIKFLGDDRERTSQGARKGLMCQHLWEIARSPKYIWCLVAGPRTPLFAHKLWPQGPPDPSDTRLLSFVLTLYSTFYRFPCMDIAVVLGVATLFSSLAHSVGGKLILIFISFQPTDIL